MSTIKRKTAKKISKKIELRPLSSITGNNTSPGYNETISGFQPPLEHVGSITREFRFTVDPWPITSTDGQVLCTLTNLILNVVKVFNPNNTTESYLTLSWSTNYVYHTIHSNPAEIEIKLVASDGAALVILNTDNLAAVCGSDPVFQSVREDFSATYFDNITAGVMIIGAAKWRKC